MGLRKLVINNFKSYGGELVVPFDGTPFVAVVGPNGSGKSNMLDALCFVIGMDAPSLRTKSIRALIHKSHTKGMSVSAEVDFSAIGEESSVTIFKRTPTDFYINGTAVSYEDYLNKWAELNVFPDARNCVIMQGDIDNVARTEAQELAWLIETLQPANTLREVTEDRKQYMAMEEEIENAARSSRKYLSARRTAQSKIDEAENVSVSGERLEELRAELHKLKTRRKALALSEKRATLKLMKRRIEEAQSEVTDSRTEIELMAADTKRLRSEYARKRKQLQAARIAEQEATEALTAAEADMAPLERKKDAIETELRLQLPEMEYAEQNMASASKEVEAAEHALQLLDRARDRERAQEDNNFSGASSLSPKLRELWNKTESEFISETALQQDDIDQSKMEADSAERQLRAMERKSEDHETELNAAHSRVRHQELRVQQLQSLLEERRSQQKQRRQELEQIAEELQNLRKERRESSEKLNALNERVKTADGNKRALAQRHKLLDTVERLRRSQPGVFDLLGNMVTPLEERYAVALERGLGNSGDALVVDNAKTAMECIKQARRERLGTLEFLPLADLRGRDLASSRARLARKTAEGEEARLLLDCCHFEQRIRPAIIYALGETAFVSEFSVGMSLRRSGAKMRIIDSQGSVISQRNTVSASFGGETSQPGSLSDRSLAAMQRKITTLAEKLKTDATQETELGDREVRVSSLIDRSSQVIDNAEKELAIARQQLDSVTRSHEYLESKTGDHQSAIAAARALADEAQRALNMRLEQLSEVRAAKFKKFLLQAGGTLAEWDARFARGAQKFAELAGQRKLLEDRMKMATDQLEAAKTQLNKLKQRQHTLESAKQRVLDQQVCANNEVTAARHRLERAQSRVRTLRTETESRSDEMGAAESAIETARARFANAEREEHRRAMALAAEVEDNETDNVDDPDGDNDDMERGENSEVSDDPNETERSRRRRQRNINGNGNKRKRNDVSAITPSSSTRSTRSNDTETLSLDRLDAKIRDLKAEIEPLATLMALVRTSRGSSEGEDVMRASQVCAELDRNAESLRSEYDSLTTRFNELKRRRAERFNSVLTLLQTALTGIYSELAGGDAQAKLTVTQKDAPFTGVDFLVMPPNKPFTPISELSGGERSMAALALLFACQKLYPAPFVALDEVDAALDFVNVASIANYIRSHRFITQFIMISLKQRLFQTANHLVGVYKERLESKILTVALN